MVKILITNKKYGEKIRLFLINNNMLDYNYKIKTINDQILIPVKEEFLEKIKEIELPYRILDEKPEKLEKREKQKTIKEIINSVTRNTAPVQIRAYDLIGDIILLKLPIELWGERHIIGEEILKNFKNVRSVFVKAGSVEGDYRVRPVECVAGDNNPVTIHRENGCLFKLDISKVYFNSRLATERLRVCKLVAGKGETVTDMFTGVGPYAILIAKTKKAIVNAIDINPDAVKFLKENIKLNKVEEYVRVFLGDARRVIRDDLSNVANRVIMNLPGSAFEFVDSACETLKDDGGIIHYYTFSGEEDIKNHIQHVIKKIKKKNYNVSVLNVKIVREVSPRFYHYSIDFKLSA